MKIIYCLFFFYSIISSCGNQSKNGTEISKLIRFQVKSLNQKIVLSPINEVKTESRVDTLSKELIKKLDSIDLSFLKNKEILCRGVDYYWMREYYGEFEKREVIRTVINAFDNHGNSYLKVLLKVSEYSMHFLSNEKVFESFNILKEMGIEEFYWNETDKVFRIRGFNGESIIHSLDGKVDDFISKIQIEVIKVNNNWCYIK